MYVVELCIIAGEALDSRTVFVRYKNLQFKYNFQLAWCFKTTRKLFISRAAMQMLKENRSC